MVINGIYAGKPLTISIKNNCLTVSLSISELPDVYSFDMKGRLWTAMSGGISYRRGLNGNVIAKWITEDANRDRRWLSTDEARLLEEKSRQSAIAILQMVENQTAVFETRLSETDRELLRRAGNFSTQRYQADVSTYQQIYKPVGILPPDQYMSLVLQVTEGCSFNTCTFCNFYRDRPFRIKDPSSLRSHIQEIRTFLDRGLSLRRTIFLGDANALVIPISRLLQLIDIIHENLDVETLGGLYAFLDGFSAERKSTADYLALAQRGFKRIYLGMESGNGELLRFLKKPGQPEDVLNSVQSIKAGGIAVGIIVLLGAGGKQYARQHVEDTVHLLNAMPLDSDDLIYFSELVEHEGIEYTRDAYQARLNPLSPAERIRQGEQIENRLKFGGGGTPHISRYDIREFVY